MSRIGKQPVVIPEGVTVTIQEDQLAVKGKNANLTVPILSGVKADIKDNELLISPLNEENQTKANWGTVRALAANAVTGAHEDFTRTLIVEGVGYRVAIEGNALVLSVGFSHPVNFPIPEGITISVDKNNINVAGADKALVGEVAAKIRKVKKPEPYKGKGIRYSDEVVRRKAGKKVAGSSS